MWARHTTYIGAGFNRESWGEVLNINLFILPGIIATEMTPFLSDENSPIYKAVVPHWKEKIKLLRMGKGEDIGAAVIYLALDDSSYVTEAELVIDGEYVIE